MKVKFINQNVSNMKKIFTLFGVFASLLAGSMSINAADFYYLEKIDTQSEMEYFRYEYSDQNKLTKELHMDYEEVNASTLRTFEYDSDGNCVVEYLYQDLYMTEDPDQFILVGKVEYTFNLWNEMVRRTAYTLDLYSNPDPANCPLVESSYLDFTYDVDGKLISVVTAFPGGMEIQRDDYLYDADGVLYQIDNYSTVFGANDLFISQRYSFYNSNILAAVSSYEVGYDGDLWRKDVTEYNYDTDWNLTDVEVWDGGHSSLISRDTYSCRDDFSLESTVYPFNFEDSYWSGFRSIYSLIRKPLDKHEMYLIDDISGQLTCVDTFIYGYSNTPAGVQGVTLPNGSKSVMLKSIRNGFVELDGIEAGQNVRVVDMQGRTVYSGKYGTGLNLSELVSGTYCITTSGGAVKFSK